MTKKTVAIVICDTEIFIDGSMDIARGSYGIEPIDRGFGEEDIYGKPKFGGVDNIVNELSATAALIMKQTSQGIPVVIIRGLEYKACECGYKERKKSIEIDKLPSIFMETIKATQKTLGMRHLLLFKERKRKKNL
ncbi:MAG: coenzyme F420-0:L-glutamate ligase [Candidatus Micrarchaeales archaeon]